MYLKLNAKIAAEIKKANGILTTAQIEALDFSRMTLSLYVKAGLLERVGHGVYALPDETRDDMFLLALNNPKIIFSHDTANGLSNRTPFVHSVSIPKNASLSAVRRENRSERRKKLRRICRKRLDAVGGLCGTLHQDGCRFCERERRQADCRHRRQNKADRRR